MAEKSIKATQFGAYLKSLRKARMLTQREVSEATKHGISCPYLSQLETGQIWSPSIRMLSHLSRVYEVPLDEMISRQSDSWREDQTSKNGGTETMTFPKMSLTKNEVDELLKYLEWYRGRDNPEHQN